MSVNQINRAFLLEAEQIDLVSQQVVVFLSRLKLEEKEIMRIRLNAEMFCSAGGSIMERK